MFVDSHFYREVKENWSGGEGGFISAERMRIRLS
jgi:hypothetical protein